MQAIPFTGVFGAGWGNIGRWDIFVVYMGVVFGGAILVCMNVCCAAWLCEHDMDEVTVDSCWGECLRWIWGVATTVLWIWGIVEIGNKPNAPWTDWHGNRIMCPLI